MKIPVAAEEEVCKILKKWKEEGIIKETIDLDSHKTEEDKNTGLFNTNEFLTFRKSGDLFITSSQLIYLSKVIPMMFLAFTTCLIKLQNQKLWYFHMLI